SRSSVYSHRRTGPKHEKIRLLIAESPTGSPPASVPMFLYPLRFCRMRSRLLGFIVLLCGLLGRFSQAQKAPPTSPTVDFQRVVRPILSENCFHCHGPDPNTRMADLRLDTKEGVFTKRENGTPVTVGDPQASLVYQRITQEDPSLRMPPESS